MPERGEPMTSLARMQKYVQEYAETIADVLGVDVTIIDEECIRIGGTGPHCRNIGQMVPHGSFFQNILKTGEPILNHDIKKEFDCQKCLRRDVCYEQAIMGYPILNKEKTVGVIGIIAFTDDQKKRLIESSPKLLNFLKHMGNLLEDKIHLFEANEVLRNQIRETMDVSNKTYSFDTIIGKEANFIKVLQRAKRIASSSSTVLIRGESGTGKELLARAIHGASPRYQYPFIAVNCSSIPENLLESELFGYVSGAFTGAKKTGKLGKFELAQKGTIFLDEIGDMPLFLQPKILRALQEKTIDKVGGEENIDIDVRVIAATHANLEEQVTKGQFREDLYYRLNVIPLNLPPLRERRADIPLFLEFFLNKYGQRLNKKGLKMDPSLKQWLLNCQWPGNIRQLENVVEYMVNLAQSDILFLNELPEYLNQRKQPLLRNNRMSLEEMLAEYEKALLAEYIPVNCGIEEKVKAAQELNISLATLYRKIEKHKLSYIRNSQY